MDEQNYLGNLTEFILTTGHVRLRVQAEAQAHFPLGSNVFASIDATQCRAFPFDTEISKETGP